MSEEFDDHLFIISHSNDGRLAECFWDLLTKHNKGTIKLTSKVEGEDEVTHFLDISNKYFNSRIKIQFGTENIFEQKQKNFDHFIYCISTIEDWNEFSQNQESKSYFREHNSLRIIFISDQMTSQIDMNRFYNDVENYVPILPFDFAAIEQGSSLNEECFDNIIEMIENHVWKHKKINSEKKKKKTNDANLE